MTAGVMWLVLHKMYKCTDYGNGANEAGCMSQTL